MSTVNPRFDNASRSRYNPNIAAVITIFLYITSTPMSVIVPAKTYFIKILKKFSFCVILFSYILKGKFLCV